MSREKRDEELLQEYLDGDSELSRLYQREADEQPDARLDARILAEARRAVSPRRRTLHSPFARHWLVPTALAAVLVLSVSMVLLMPDPALEPGVERELSLPPEPAPASVDTAPRQSFTADRELDEAVGKVGEQPRLERKRATPGAAQSLPAAPAAGGMAEEAPSAAMPARAREPLPLPRPDPMPSDAVRDDPEAWLRFIEMLLDEQNRDAARSNLRAFRARYSDYPLPSRLASLASEKP